MYYVLIAYIKAEGTTAIAQIMGERDWDYRIVMSLPDTEINII